MAHAEVPPIHNPLERLGDTVKAVPAWAGRHWKSLSLVAATLAGSGYMLINHGRGPDNPPIQPTAPASDTFNRPDSGLGVVIPQETATATATEAPKPPPISPEFAQKLIAEIGSPISYKTAPKNSLLSSHYEWMKANNKLDEFGSPDIRFDEKGNVLIPVYPQSLLGELNSIDPAKLPNPKQNEGGMIAIQEIVNGDLVRAREAFKQGKTSAAKEALEKAEQDMAGKTFDGVEMVKPKTPEEQAKFGTMGRMLGVAKPLLDFYLRLVEMTNSIPIIPSTSTMSARQDENVLAQPETLKSMSPAIMMIDFFGTEVEGVGLKKEPVTKTGFIKSLLGAEHIGEDELAEEFGPNFSSSLASLKKVAGKNPDVALAYGAWEMYRDHGKQVAQVLRQTLSRFGYESPFEGYSLQNFLTSDQVRLTQDESGNRNYSVRINPDSIIEALAGYPDQKVVNMSFQVGKISLVLTVTDTTARVRLKEAYGGDMAEENLSELFRICEAFPDKLFIVAAGNLVDDLTATDKSFPKNLLTVAEWNGRTGMPQAEILGADIYVNNSSFEAPPGSSFSTPVVSGIIQVLLNQGLSIEEAKAKVFQITTPGRFETHGNQQEVRVLNLQRLQISNN